MDTRVRDWSTDKHDAGLSAAQLRRAFFRVLGIVVAIWVFLFAAFRLLPFVENGAGSVGQLKVAIAARASLFEQSSKIRLFTFGNSQIMSGIVPVQLDRELGRGVETFNLGLPGEERYVNLLEAALKAGNIPTTILVQALPIKAEHMSPWETFLDNKKLVSLLFPFKDFTRDLVVFAFEAKGPVGLVRQYSSNRNQVDQVSKDHGYYFIKSQSHYPNDELPSDYALPSDQPNRLARREFDRHNPEFERLVALAARYDFQVVLIPSAFREGAYAPPPPEDADLTTALAEFPRFHVVGPPYLLLPPSYFADPLHLNPKGASRYTEYLVSIVSSHLSAAK